MEKDLPPKLERDKLRQLATEQLVEIIIEQANAIEQFKTRVIELEIVIEKLKVSREIEQHNIIKTTVGRHPQKIRE
jgi:transposase